MNSYMNISSTQILETPLYIVFLLYILGPITTGTLIDILINKGLGPQHCSFEEGEKTCTFYGFDVKTWQRELVRFLLQISVTFLLIIVLQKYINKPLYLNTAIVLFIVSQTYLFDDFRRFLANIIFLINHNN